MIGTKVNNQKMSFDLRAKKIYLFRNGDIKTQAKRIVVSGRLYRNFEQVFPF